MIKKKYYVASNSMNPLVGREDRRRRHEEWCQENEFQAINHARELAKVDGLSHLIVKIIKVVTPQGMVIDV